MATKRACTSSLRFSSATSKDQNEPRLLCSRVHCVDVPSYLLHAVSRRNSAETRAAVSNLEPAEHKRDKGLVDGTDVLSTPALPHAQPLPSPSTAIAILIVFGRH